MKRLRSGRRHSERSEESLQLRAALRDLLRMYSEGVHTTADRDRLAEIRQLAGGTQ